MRNAATIFPRPRCFSATKMLRVSTNRSSLSTIRRLLAGAARGFLGSGNEAIALQEYGMGFANDYLHQQEQFLSGLAGSGISPNFGAALGGYGAGADLSGQGLAGLAYGTTRFGGAAAGTPASGRPSSAGGEAATVSGAAVTSGSTCEVRSSSSLRKNLR